jgi:hypothetical protein
MREPRPGSRSAMVSHPEPQSSRGFPRETTETSVSDALVAYALPQRAPQPGP